MALDPDKSFDAGSRRMPNGEESQIAVSDIAADQPSISGMLFCHIRLRRDQPETPPPKPLPDPA
jgi:hypothetical protein